MNECITDEKLEEKLQGIDPTEEELERTEKSIRILEYIWTKELKINWTPKALLTFVYLARQQREFGGLGDKSEDFGESLHQSRVRNVRRTHSISKDFDKQEANHTRWEFAKSDPKIEAISQEVKLKSKRNFIGLHRETKGARMLSFLETHGHLADLSEL